MIMDTLYKKMLLFIVALSISSSFIAQEEVSKQITENFTMTNAGEIQLENKYGEVNFSGWDKNNIAITIDISVTHKKKDNAKELLNRIKPSVKSQGDLVSVQFEIEDRNSNLFNRYFKKVNPVDLDRNNVHINYTIYLPKNAEINVINKFGDVIIDNWNGKLTADVQHGDIWINENLNNADLDVKYGKIRAKSMNYGNIRLKNGSLDFEDAIDLRLTSAGSDIEVEKITSLEIYSSKDNLTISELGKLRGNLKFSEMELDKLTDNINITMKIAELKVSKVLKKDADIIIDQVSSEIDLNISGFAFNFNATLEEGLLRLPKAFDNVSSEMINKGKRIRKITGSYGNSSSGKVSITGKKGVILLKE